jgi:hypothetical protein|tara:strand:+ start:340 stop:486 length:147 start_codon:yes stop_codon:yes gene_type:complete
MVEYIKNKAIALIQYSYQMDTLAFDIWNISSEDEGSKTLDNLSNRSSN